MVWEGGPSVINATSGKACDMTAFGDFENVSMYFYKLIAVFKWQTYDDPSQRLELCFRPKDAGCRPLFASRQACKGFLLKVRRRRCQDTCVNTTDKEQKSKDVCTVQNDSESLQSTSLSCSMFQYSAEVIGIVETVYKFQSKYSNISFL